MSQMEAQKDAYHRAQNSEHFIVFVTFPADVEWLWNGPTLKEEFSQLVIVNVEG